MDFVTVIAGFFNGIVLGLSPVERLDAVTKYHSNSGSNQSFIIIGLVIAAILTVLLIISIFYREKVQKPSRHLFSEYAKAKELTDREYRMLMDIAANTGLRKNESIFTLPSLFDREAANMVKNTQAKRGIEQSQQLQGELALLREKLGFHRYTSPDTISTTEAEAQSSRQIPLKKKIYIKRNHQQANGDLEATVIKNTPAGLTVQFRTPVEIIFGQSWICRYYSGAYVSEFNTTPVKCSGQIVVLNHSHHIRQINRRKFLRVPVKKPAYIANFPFKKEPATEDRLLRKKITAVQNTSDRADDYFEPPRFVPATVTELGGPGLRINTDLSLSVGDRVLLMFKLDHNKKAASLSKRKTDAEKIIEHIAQVRHITSEGSARSVALELTGLNDDGIDELIRATNEASFGMNRWSRRHPDSHVRRSSVPERMTV